MPTPAGIMPEFSGSDLNGYFVADCRELMSPGIALWISGHTHGSLRLRDAASGVPLVCNPRGYQLYGERENPDFDPAATYRLG